MAVILDLWAKLPRVADGQGYHPLLCHLLDVAVTARAMWRLAWPVATRRQLAAALELDEPAAEAWVAFLAGLHDLGKASPAFQLRAPWSRAALLAAGLPCPPQLLPAPHGAVTTKVLPPILATVYGVPERVARDLATAIGGHHGVLPPHAEVQRLPGDGVGDARWDDCRRAVVVALAVTLGVPPVPPRRLDHPAALILAGLVSVADWIGSDESQFPYAVTDRQTAPAIDLAEYAARADEQARAALARLAWAGWPDPAAPATFEAMFERPPRPLQKAAIDLAEALAEPALIIIEAPMGEGKTEAALYLADRLNRALGQRGSYVAMPTQATSDQMFGRVAAALARRYPDQLINLQLLHGHAALSAELALLRERAHQLLAPAGVATDSDEGDQAAVVAAEWFTHRKRGLLAPFGVGTIDQALLAVLRTHHVFVRLFGLAHKTIIFDEVHAYDTYMTELLERLLEWLAALGAPVILLSATLPAVRRAALTAAYARGLGAGAAPSAPPAAYPRLSWTTAAAAGAVTVPASPAATKCLTLDWVDLEPPAADEPSWPLAERLRAALAGGGCAAVICNTVRRAQTVYAALRRVFPDRADDGEPELGLLHARYPAEERARRERLALRRFGPPNGQAGTGPAAEPVRRPRRAVLVATQVIEQSLDLDFDLMVTDLAPADLILQRAGRLHRHDRARPTGLAIPRLWIGRPAADDGGAPVFDRGSAAVYDGHVLLRSWLALRERATLAIPDEVEALVEAVYDPARLCPAGVAVAVRDLWEATRRRQEEAAAADRHEATRRWLKRPSSSGALSEIAGDPRREDAPDFHPAHQALTRLSEPTVAVVCLYGPADRPALDPAGAEPVNPRATPALAEARRLLGRSVGISERGVVQALLQQAPPAGWQRSPLLRQHRLLALDPSDHSAEIDGYRLRLDPELGVVVERPGRPRE